MSRKKTTKPIEEQKSVRSPIFRVQHKKHKKHSMHPNSLRNLIAPWPKGVSANPGGRPLDVAAKIARIIFQQNEEQIYLALSRALLSGNAWVFKELAERAFGKITDRIELSSDAELIAKLEAGRKRLQAMT